MMPGEAGAPGCQAGAWSPLVCGVVGRILARVGVGVVPFHPGGAVSSRTVRMDFRSSLCTFLETAMSTHLPHSTISHMITLLFALSQLPSPAPRSWITFHAPGDSGGHTRDVTRGCFHGYSVEGMPGLWRLPFEVHHSTSKRGIWHRFYKPFEPGFPHLQNKKYSF